MLATEGSFASSAKALPDPTASSTLKDKILRESHLEARRPIQNVRPIQLDEMGVVAAIAHLIRGLEETSGPQVEFDSQVDFDRLEPVEENAIYRIVQEGLTNAQKYSQSERVHVELVQQGATIRIAIRDWGLGFDTDKVGQHTFGLEGIRERARLLGGRAEIESAPGAGTRIAVELPVMEREARG